MHFGKFEVKPIEAPEKSLSEWTVPDKLKAEIPQTPEGRLEDIKNKINQLAQEISAERSLRLPRNGGIWDGAIGNSKWIPAEDAVPGSRNGTNPEHKSWSQIKECYSGKPITEAERASYKRFQENKQAMLNLLAEKVIEFINENFDVPRFNWPEAKKIQDASELSTVLMPTSLLFKQDGTTLLLFECAWEIQMLAFPFKYIQIGKWEGKICSSKVGCRWLWI